ncbi:MAG: T9SS type A sorting domain-containing protein [Bacteroidetes bacterium]|nr:T9SS type A sorting domain-containing protein [Bacteroidota bacterium]
MEKKLFLAAMLCAQMLGMQVMAQTIATVRTASIGSTVTVRGIVTNGSELGSIRYVQNGTAGIAIYGSNLSSLQRGNSVVATGPLTNYNNLLEVTPVNSFTDLGPQTLPAFQTITVPQMNETTEGELVRFDNCTFALGGGTFAGNTNYNVTSGGQTLQVRIANTSPLVGTVIPAAAVHLTGIASQFCVNPTSGCTTGYQLLLRDANDILQISTIFITAATTQTNISTTSFDLNWSTNVAGTNSYLQYGTTPALTGGTVTANNATNHTVTLTSLSPATVYYAKAYSILNQDTAVTLIAPFCTQSLSSGKITAYFNRIPDLSQSTGVDARYIGTKIADTLAAYINRATISLDICIYNWDNLTQGMKIVSAVNNAHQRGVAIRMIYDGSTNNSCLNSLNGAIKRLASPGGINYSIMHNKFVIIDENASDPNLPVVWTGSTNWTDQQLTEDANNVIIFQDQSLARGYKLEFDEMWGNSSQTAAATPVNSKFGQYKSDNTPHEYIIGGNSVQSYFSPSDQTNTQILNTIGTADTDLYFAQFVTTRSDLAYKIKDQIALNGLDSKGLIDDSSSSAIPYGILKPTMLSNLALYKHSWLLHQKYLIVDQSDFQSDPLVLTGSHNWSNNGNNKNDENTVIVHNLILANQYYQEFMGRWCEREGMTCTLSGTEDALQMELGVFPNPNNGNFNVRFEATADAVGVIELYDLTGKLVYATSNAIQSGINQISVTTAGLPRGMYALRMVAGETTWSSRVMLQ